MIRDLDLDTLGMCFRQKKTCILICKVKWPISVSSSDYMVFWTTLPTKASAVTSDVGHHQRQHFFCYRHGFTWEWHWEACCCHTSSTSFTVRCLHLWMSTGPYTMSWLHPTSGFFQYSVHCSLSCPGKGHVALKKALFLVGQNFSQRPKF